MKPHLLFLLGVAALAAVPGRVSVQEAGYPIEVIPPGKGPFTFPPGYQTPWEKIQIMVTSKMSPNLFVLHGSQGLDPAHPDASGGRIMVLFGPDGVLMVDTQNRQVADKTLQAIRSFTDAPIRILVNTHIHGDHTGANAFFAKQGALIYAQENLRNEMLRPPLRASGQAAPAPDPAAVPVATYNYSAATGGQPAVTFNMNGEIVDFIPMMPSHTAGDTIVRFRKANAIYIEDFYRNFGYPFADQANGGSLQGMLDAVDLIQELAGPNTTLIPGHGTLVKKQDLLPYRAMIVDIMTKVKTLRSQGKSLKEILAANLTAPYDKTTQGDTQQSKDRFITEAYHEAQDLPPVVDGKRTMPVAMPATLPNPYRLEPDWPTLPATMKGPNGRKWGEVIRVHVAPNGNIWVFHRCFNDQPNGDATCLNRGAANPPILEFNPAGRLLRSLGVGLFAHPHGFTIDKDGNIWTTDTNDAETILGMPARDAQGVKVGQVVRKISPTGKVLMTIGTQGVGGIGPYTFDRPTGVAIAPNGDIFVSDGHSGNKSNSGRIVKYSPDGKFIKTWGRQGPEPGNFRDPHDLYVGGSKGYVYVADRQNNRVQVFDQEGTFVAAWRQFGQPSSVYVDKQDNIYIGATYPTGSGGESLFKPMPGANNRAIVIGNAITGELKYLIPDPGDLSKMPDTGTSASGIAVDDRGTIYAADVGFNNLRKYVKVE